MLPILLPIGVLLLGGLAYRKAAKKDTTAKIGEDSNGLSPERSILYQTALRKVEDPAKLRSFAAEFRSQGLEPQAIMLEKRANLRALPQETKRARRDVFRRAMKSTNKTAILTVADAYEREGATSAADALRAYAEGLAA